MGKMIELEYKGEKFPAYVTSPDGEVKGGIIVIHEVWGLVDHTKDVADRFAKEGYEVIAPDLLNILGISQELAGELQEELFDPERRAKAQPKLRELMSPMQAPSFAEDTLAKVKLCFKYLSDIDSVKERIAITGFCFGGSYSYSLAVHEPNLKAAIPFYGHADYTAVELSKINCPILAFYGENDERLIDSLEELKAKMKEAGVNFNSRVFSDAGHAFFNDTNKFTYNSSASEEAWQLTKDFLTKHLN